MFMFGKMKLSKKIQSLSLEGSEKLLALLKEDEFLYSKSMAEDIVKVSGAIFVINIIRDALNRKHSSKSVFVMTSTAIKTLAHDKSSEDLFMKGYFESISVYNQSFEYYKGMPNFDAIAVATKVFLGSIIDDKDFLMAELETTIPQSRGYKKIYNYIKNELLVACAQL